MIVTEVIGEAPTRRGSVGDPMARMTEAMSGDQVVRLVAGAFSVGSVTRTEILAVAVEAHAPTPVFDALLSLPERRHNDVFDLRGQLMLRPA